MSLVGCATDIEDDNGSPSSRLRTRRTPSCTLFLIYGVRTSVLHLAERPTDETMLWPVLHSFLALARKTTPQGPSAVISLPVVILVPTPRTRFEGALLSEVTMGTESVPRSVLTGVRLMCAIPFISRNPWWPRQLVLNMLLTMESVCMLRVRNVLMRCRPLDRNIWCIICSVLGEAICRLLMTGAPTFVVVSLLPSRGLVLRMMTGASLIRRRKVSDEIRPLRLLCRTVLLIPIMVNCPVLSREKCPRHRRTLPVEVTPDSSWMTARWSLVRVSTLALGTDDLCASACDAPESGDSYLSACGAGSGDAFGFADECD